MWTRALLKQNGRIAFQRNYWPCVGASWIAALLGGSMMSSTVVETDFSQLDIPTYYLQLLSIVMMITAVVGLCVTILVSNVVAVGNNRYFLENREHKTDINQVFYGFREGRYSANVWIMFLRSLYIAGWTLLFIVPGIVKSYSYLLVPYILAENTELDKDRVFEMSSQMMRGHKMEAFVLSLSFFGWALLGTMSAGIVNIFYTNPYMNATYAEFYSAVKAEAFQRGIVTREELPGVSVQEVEI